jgi:hypothetical protein
MEVRLALGRQALPASCGVVVPSRGLPVNDDSEVVPPRIALAMVGESDILPPSKNRADHCGIERRRKGIEAPAPRPKRKASCFEETSSRIRRSQRREHACVQPNDIAGILTI